MPKIHPGPASNAALATKPKTETKKKAKTHKGNPDVSTLPDAALDRQTTPEQEIEVPSQQDSSRPAGDNATPTLLEYQALEARVSALENQLANGSGDNSL